VPFQSCIFTHPVVYFNALVLEAYLLKISRAMPRAIIVFFALIKYARAIFKLVTEAKHCIRQSVLQAGPNAILYGYIAVR